MSTILAAHTWRTNGDLIADVARLYISDEATVVDVTYGRGLWWTKYQPQRFTAHDRRLDGVDFRALPEDDASIDVVAYDPPYVSVGGRKTSGMPDLLDRYGLTDAATTPADLQRDINDGLVEVHRILKRRGIALVKCQDYISSGKLWPGTHRTLTHAERIGFEFVDRFEHIARSPRPQPGGRRQVHARRNLSTLLVLRKAVAT